MKGGKNGINLVMIHMVGRCLGGKCCGRRFGPDSLDVVCAWVRAEEWQWGLFELSFRNIYCSD